MIDAARPDETEPSLQLAIGIRRRPNVVPSDEDTQKLIVDFVRALLNAPSDGREHRLALAVAGRQTHAEQLAQLASLARHQMTATAFFDLVEEEGRFPRELRDRLGYLRTMVGTALSTLEVENTDDALARDTTWRLLTLLAYDKNFDDRGTHTLEAARALLNLAAAGEDAPLHDAIAAYADNSARLAGLLRALNGAAEEPPSRAEAARRLWPVVITQVLELNADGHSPFRERHYGGRALSSLLPTPTHDIEFLYRELHADPISWPAPLSWDEAIDAWMIVAMGDPDGVDALIGLLRPLVVGDQVTFGLPRVAALVLADVDQVSRRAYLLSSWLTDIRDAAIAGGAQAEWQRLVDALVVAGDRSLAPYSE